MGKKAIPDRWLDYRPIGQCISGTKIVAFKVPLKMNICQTKLPQNEWFTPEILLEKQPGLRTVIDLTNTYRYYNGDMEFGTKGIDHVKILVEGKGIIPPQFQVQRFFDAIDSHMEKYAHVTDALIGVHCTHGLNRTGYFICRWMVDRLKLDPNEAIERFNQARGHGIERKNLLDDLKIQNKPLIADLLSGRNEYSSPLADDSYKEPHKSGYNSRYSDRSRLWRNDVNRGPRNDGFRRRDSFDTRNDRSRERRDRNKPSRADLDTNWRARDEETRPRFHHTGSRKSKSRR